MRFTYTKASGGVSHRNLVVLRKPSNAYFGIDVTDIEDIEVSIKLAEFIAKQNEELSQYISEQKLTGRYRTFLTEGVSIDTMDL